MRFSPVEEHVSSLTPLVPGARPGRSASRSPVGESSTVSEALHPPIDVAWWVPAATVAIGDSRDILEDGPGDQSAPSETLTHAIRRAGVGPELADQLTALVRACATTIREADTDHPAPAGEPEESAASARVRARELLDALTTLTGATARIEGLILDAAKRMTAANGRLLLANKGATTPDDLSTTQRDRWRARAKSVTRDEIGAATGWGPGEVADLVSLATTPSAVFAPVRRCLGAGVVTWRLARSYFRSCRGLPHAPAAAIASALFGTDPHTAVTERLTATGTLISAPWQHREFSRALDREVTKVALADPTAVAATKRRVLQASDLRVSADADGTATVFFTGSTTQCAAIFERIDAGARRIRKRGDARPLNQIRTAMAATLLLHGTARSRPTRPAASCSPTWHSPTW